MAYQKLNTDEGESAKDEGESTTSTRLSEDSISDIPTGSSEDSKPIERSQVPTVFNKFRCDQHPYEDKCMTEFESPKENREQIIVKDNKLLSINFTVEIENRKVQGPITYSLHQQIFKFKVNDGHKESQETSNSDIMINLELWGVNVDCNSYDQKWTIDGILQNMGFYPPTENPCVMMRENLKIRSSEYIVIYQDDLYISLTTTEETQYLTRQIQDQYQSRFLSRR